MAYAIKEGKSTRIFTVMRTWEFQTVRIYNEEKSSLINLNNGCLEGMVPNVGTVIYFSLVKPALVEQAQQYFGTDRIRVSTTEDTNGLGFKRLHSSLSGVAPQDNGATASTVSSKGFNRVALNQGC